MNADYCWFPLNFLNSFFFSSELYQPIVSFSKLVCLLFLHKSRSLLIPLLFFCSRLRWLKHRKRYRKRRLQKPTKLRPLAERWLRQSEHRRWQRSRKRRHWPISPELRRASTKEKAANYILADWSMGARKSVRPAAIFNARGWRRIGTKTWTHS